MKLATMNYVYTSLVNLNALSNHEKKVRPKDDRYDIISVEELDRDVQGVVSSDTSEKWSVWHKSIEIFHKFHELPKEAESFYLSIFEPLKEDIVLKDKDGVEYQLVTTVSGSNIYIKEYKVVKTHGITFSNFTLIDKDASSAEKAGIFDDMEAFRDPDSTKTQVEKEKLNKLFADILQKIKVDKDKNGRLEAGELAGLSLTKPKRDELSHFIVEHTSEWHKDNEERTKVIELLDKLIDKIENEKTKKVAKENIAMMKERIETLSFFPKNPELAFIHPIALIEGFVEGGRFDWSKTPIIKLIVSKESKGSYSAYNITGWTTSGTNKVYESHFKAEGTYLITSMTLEEIKLEQSTMVGINRKHLFAIGLYQMIPKTFEATIKIKDKKGKIIGTKKVGFLPWLKKKKTINESMQLFDEAFQDLMPLYFWEAKQKDIGKYFKGNKTSEEAAYAVSKEWASAGVPNGLYTKSGAKSDGTVSYYGGDGLNKAHYSATKTVQALEDTKTMLDAYGGYEKVLKENFN